MFDDYVEGMIMKSQLSVETLFYCCTCWKDNIVLIWECLCRFKTQNFGQHDKLVLNYLGGRNLNDNYLLLIPEANWVIKLGYRCLKKNGWLVPVDVQALVSFA